MNNETDLDWLARNVHEWKGSERCVSVCNGVIRWTVGSKPMDGLTWFTKSEWLTRRAELQNKPRWGSVGSDINFISQHDDGQWIGHSEKPSEADECFECNCVVSLFGYGEVLGDWRDTLEKRPEEFQPLTSIEDNQEQDMTKQQEMKQDNGWFERGELPPVGVECEAKKYGKEEWYKVVICGAGKHLGLAVAFYEKQKGSGAFTCSSAEYFRPIRTEREVAIEEMQSDIAERWANCEELAKYLVEKGWVKAGK